MAETGKKKILIVEDERAIARALELKLTHSGFEVTVAQNGEEGIAHAKENRPDLILLDLVMPKMDGFATLEKLKAEKITSPVIITSNLSQEDDEKHARELGAVDFFIKSNTPLSEIVKHVEEKLA